VGGSKNAEMKKKSLFFLLCSVKGTIFFSFERERDNANQNLKKSKS